VFTVMDDIARLGWRIFSRFVGPTEEPPSPVPVTAAGRPTHLADSRRIAQV
jgi:hypothetical protein